jgi:hypothetical protein
MAYVQGNWVWYTGGNTPFWGPPLPGCLGVVDMRSPAECGIPGTVDGEVGGEGMFLYPEGVVTAGTALDADEAADILLDRLLVPANVDVTGVAKPRPLMPTSRRMLELHLGGLIWSHETGPGDTYWPVVREQYRHDFADRRAYDEAHGLEAHRKMLGHWMRQWGVDDPAEFQYPGEVVEPLPPDTTVTDSFNRSDNTDLNASSTGKSPNFTWTEVSASWAIGSNTLNEASGGTVNGYVRADIDLSSADMYTQMRVKSGSNHGGQYGPLARVAAAADTFYIFLWTGFSTNRNKIFKCVTGTFTDIGTGGSAVADDDVLKCDCSGSTITGYRNGASGASTTDTAIPGNLRGGILGYNVFSYVFDEFEMADAGGAAAPAAIGARYQMPGLMVYGGRAA